jgi:uncharacterized protein YbjT (DUF2867 family)
MRHLILGGTGTVGGAVVAELLARGEKNVRVLTRSPEKAAKLPKGTTSVIGDLADPTTYKSVFQDFDTLFLLNLVTPAELQEGLAAVNEAHRAKAKRIVYLSVHDAEKGMTIPHFAAKVAIEAAIRETGIAYTMIRPNNFHQNDYWFKDVILQYGIYPQPIGEIGLARVDVRDIAEASANALTRSGHENQSYALVGPDAVSGEACAKQWSDALGRTVKYSGNDLDAWEKQSLAFMPAWAVYDFRLMYEMFQAKGLKATPAQMKECETIVGHAPRSYRDFVRETVTAWK